MDKFFRRMRRFNQRMARNYQRGFGPRKLVLLLTTTGRKSGLAHVTPLQYEEDEGVYYVGSARGTAADWYRNLLVNPQVQVQVRDQQFPATAEAASDPERVADFLAWRLKRHPLMLRLIMWGEGLPLRYTRADLLRFASDKAYVTLRPIKG